MSIKINFDAAGVPEEPTIVLAKRNGDRIGKINAKEIQLTDNLNDASQMTFVMYKTIDGTEDALWDEVVDFRLVYCVEWNQFFEITVELNEGNDIKKTVTCTQLGAAELGQIMLYNVEINTETDIEREEYEIPTTLYKPDHPEASLLHRITTKAPHYSIKHVDATIANIQRTFTFSDTSIYDALTTIAEEIDCQFIIDTYLNDDGKLVREISAYDLEATCKACGYRGEFVGQCPECGSDDVTEGYGEDTTVFITADELGDNIQLTQNTDEMKNCFKLEGGDDLINATIKNCNPNGSDYIWYISDDMKTDMSDDLRAKLESYDTLYDSYQDAQIEINKTSYDVYKALVDKYKTEDNDISIVEYPFDGYNALIEAYYDAIDMYLFLNSSLMPDAGLEGTTAEDEVAKLTVDSLSPASTNSSLRGLSVATADSIALSVAKVIVDSRYQTKVVDGSLLSDYDEMLDYRVWTGKFVITSYSNDDDTATTKEIAIKIDENYANFIKQKIDKLLAREDVEDVGITGLFKMDLDEFKEQLKQYSLQRLTSFHDGCQSCIDIMVEQGVADKQTWADKNPDLYEELYVPYLNKLAALSDEMDVRQKEIEIVVGTKDEDGNTLTKGFQDYIEEKIAEIQDVLDFEKYLGEELWLEFCMFRREDKYSNDNYISDGLNNAELIEKAMEFIDTAEKEIYKSAELQRTITSDLKNLLVIKKFQPIVEYFKVGNWVRVLVDDNVYKLRLLEYTIDYDNLESLSVTFGDEVRNCSTIKSVQDVLSQAATMATSYSSVQRQAKQGEKSNDVIDAWFENGLDTTNAKIVNGSDNQSQTWDNHGMLFRKYDSALGEYEPTQMKIINSTIAITDDNWQTTKTAIGQYYYFDESGKMQTAYGVNGETIVGKLFLGEKMRLSNTDGTMSFDDGGLVIQNNNVSVTIKPDDDSPVLAVKDKETDQNVFVVDSDGMLTITGKINATDISLIDGGTTNQNITGFADIAFDGKYAHISGGNPNDQGNVLTFDEDGKVISQKLRANNISGLAPVATTGSYSNLSNTPTLADVATSGKYTDLIGVPDIKNVAVTGKYNDLSGDTGDAGKILYVSNSGAVTAISISDLKQLLANV